MAATAVGAYLVETFLQLDRARSVIVADIASDEALKLIAKIEPRIIYLSEVRFTAGDKIEGALDELSKRIDDEEVQSFRSDERLISLENRWRRYDGQLIAVFLAFMADGILHASVTTADWSDEFDGALERIVADLRQEAEDEEFNLDNTDSEEICEKAEVLAAHKSFCTGRTSFDKRVFLAENLFPNLEPSTLHRITKRAENLDWLTKTGFVPNK